MTHRYTCVTLLWCSLLLCGSLAAAPRLTIPEGTFDFGYVPRNSTVSHMFWLKSTGTDSLKINSVDPTCGCTKAPLEKDRLAAGDSTRMEIIFNTGVYTGPVYKNPRIQTNESQFHQEVHFKATVLIKPDSTRPIVIVPYGIDLSKTGPAEQLTATFTIKNVSSTALTPALIEASTAYFRVSLPAIIPAGRSATGVIRLTKKGARESFEKSFTMQVNDLQRSRFTVPVKRDTRLSGQMAAPATGRR